MFISRLKIVWQITIAFAEHRINGLKAVFVLELLFSFNYVLVFQIRIFITFIFH